MAGFLVACDSEAPSSEIDGNNNTLFPPPSIPTEPIAPATPVAPITPLVNPEPGWVNDQRIVDSPLSEPGSWLTYGQNYKEQRFSQLSQITPENVDELG
ncbi:MAG TPA: hypothetical protein DEG93_08885, partial [Gammaproteobacteria bacterium]|nr:hypothetical protein [Gammaproteobacteria bacterium]